MQWMQWNIDLDVVSIHFRVKAYLLSTYLAFLPMKTILRVKYVQFIGVNEF